MIDKETTEDVIRAKLSVYWVADMRIPIAHSSEAEPPGLQRNARVEPTGPQDPPNIDIDSCILHGLAVCGNTRVADLNQWRILNWK